MQGTGLEFWSRRCADLNLVKCVKSWNWSLKSVFEAKDGGVLHRVLQPRLGISIHLVCAGTMFIHVQFVVEFLAGTSQASPSIGLAWSIIESLVSSRAWYKFQGSRTRGLLCFGVMISDLNKAVAKRCSGSGLLSRCMRFIGCSRCHRLSDGANSTHRLHFVGTNSIWMDELMLWKALSRLVGVQAKAVSLWVSSGTYSYHAFDRSRWSLGRLSQA